MPKRRGINDVVAVGLRLREGLRLKLEQEAKLHGRSFNAEIVERLNESFSLREQIKNQDELVRSISEATEALNQKYGKLLLRQFIDMIESGRFMERVDKLTEDRQYKLLGHMEKLTKELQELQHGGLSEGQKK